MSGVIGKLLFGGGPIKEYITVTIEDEIKEKVYIVINNTIIDVSQNHWLLCLEPAVFGVWVTDQINLPATAWKEGCKMYFTDSAKSSCKEIIKSSIADLTLGFFGNIDEKDGTLILLKLLKSTVNHINPLKTRILYSRYYKRDKFSFFNLKSFASAYSYPRKVRVISFKQNDYYNIFPMDLVGDISVNGRYVFGLRHTNVALSKIIETKKIVVSEFSYKYKDVIYQLGSHHSFGPPALDKLPFKIIESRNFGFYMPEWIDSYKEINIVKTINLGSHMLLWGEILDECIINNPSKNLYHIHYLLYLYQKSKKILYPAV